MRVRIESKINDGLAEAPPLEYDVDYKGIARLVGAPQLGRNFGELLAYELVNDETGGWRQPGYTVEITVVEDS